MQGESTQLNTSLQATQSGADNLHAPVSDDNQQPTTAMGGVDGAGPGSGARSNEPLSALTQRFFGFFGGGEDNEDTTTADANLQTTVAAEGDQHTVASVGGVDAAEDEATIDNSDMVEHVLDLVRPRLGARSLDAFDRNESKESHDQHRGGQAADAPQAALHR